MFFFLLVAQAKWGGKEEISFLTFLGYITPHRGICPQDHFK